MKQQLVFNLGVQLDNPALSPLVHVIDYLRLTLDAGNALQSGGRLGEHAEQYLMLSLLMSAGHNHSRALAGEAQRSLLPRVVRKAQEYMAVHAEQPLSLSDVCREVGCSARTLQMAFRQRAGLGLMEFLRDLRLDKVRSELRTPGHAGVRTVAEMLASCTWAISRPCTARASANGLPKRGRGAHPEAAATPCADPLSWHSPHSATRASSHFLWRWARGSARRAGS